MSKLVYLLAASLILAACTPDSAANTTDVAQSSDVTDSTPSTESSSFVANSFTSDTAAIALSVLSTYQSGIFDGGGAEIVTFDPESEFGFVVNAASTQIDIFDLSDPSNPTLELAIDASALGADANSVSIYDGVAAVAIQADPKTELGLVAFFNLEGELISQVPAGALPDALTFTPDGRYVLVANEGEPNDDYSVDPEGSITIIDLEGGIENLSEENVRTADFTAFNGQEDNLRDQGIRIFGPGSSAAQDFEPEWVAVTADSSTAYVSLQENNAIAVIDIESATVTSVLPLGTKTWLTAGNGFDASDEDDAINIQNWPVLGTYMPDTIRLYESEGETYIVTANEGDAREYEGFVEEYRIGDEEVTLAADVFPDAEVLQETSNLGRLRFSTAQGYRETPECVELVTSTGDPSECEFESLHVFGARSMSIFQVTDDGLEQVFDTGSQMEETIAEFLPDYFNSTNDENDSLDNRSDDKGPEPEGMAIGEIDGRVYAFVGIERIGGLMVYDITVPAETTFVQYINNRDFALENTPESLTTTDLGAEGIHFIAADDSPNGQPLVMVGNEVSGTTTLFAIESLN